MQQRLFKMAALGGYYSISRDLWSIKFMRYILILKSSTRCTHVYRLYILEENVVQLNQ